MWQLVLLTLCVTHHSLVWQFVITQCYHSIHFDISCSSVQPKNHPSRSLSSDHHLHSLCFLSGIQWTPDENGVVTFDCRNRNWYGDAARSFPIDAFWLSLALSKWSSKPNLQIWSLPVNSYYAPLGSLVWFTHTVFDCLKNSYHQNGKEGWFKCLWIWYGCWY